jgi:hypothetical protein
MRFVDGQGRAENDWLIYYFIFLIYYYYLLIIGAC